MKAGCSLMGLILFIILFSFGIVYFIEGENLLFGIGLTIVSAVGAIVCFIIMKVSKWANTSSGSGKKKRKSHDGDDDDDDDYDDDSDNDSGSGGDGGGDGGGGDGD